MTRTGMFLAAAAALVVLGVVRTTTTTDLVRQVVGFNVAGTGVLLVLVTLAARPGAASPDPVPHALVLTGIVVTVSVTAVALGLARRVETDQADRVGDGSEPP